MMIELYKGYGIYRHDDGRFWSPILKRKSFESVQDIKSIIDGFEVR